VGTAGVVVGDEVKVGTQRYPLGLVVSAGGRGGLKSAGRVAFQRLRGHGFLLGSDAGCEGDIVDGGAEFDPGEDPHCEQAVVGVGQAGNGVGAERQGVGFRVDPLFDLVGGQRSGAAGTGGA
jgi:hypothetical protein